MIQSRAESMAFFLSLSYFLLLFICWRLSSFLSVPYIVSFSFDIFDIQYVFTVKQLTNLLMKNKVFIARSLIF